MFHCHLTISSKLAWEKNKSFLNLALFITKDKNFSTFWCETLAGPWKGAKAKELGCLKSLHNKAADRSRSPGFDHISEFQCPSFLLCRDVFLYRSI